MSKVYKIGISFESNKEIKEVNSIEVISNKGVVGDRHFNEFNDPYCQLSLIEAENIDYYNSKYGLNILYVNFLSSFFASHRELHNQILKDHQC